MSTFEKNLVCAIFSANLTNNFEEVNKMVQGTEFEAEASYHGATIFQLVSRLNARSLLNSWLTTGKKPVATQTHYSWDEHYGEEAEVYEVSYLDYYTCMRPAVDSHFVCFYPHFEAEAKKMGIEIIENENGFELLETEDKYEQMAADFGYAA